MKNSTKTIASWLLVGSIMTTCFILISALLPKVFSKYTPFEAYLEIDSILVEDIELPEESQTATIAYTADRSLPAEVQAQLLLVEIGNDTEKIISRADRDIVFEKEKAQSSLKLTRALPEDLQPGEFVWVYNFQIDVNGVTKSSTVRSNAFQVTK